MEYHNVLFHIREAENAIQMRDSARARDRGPAGPCLRPTLLVVINNLRILTATSQSFDD